MATTRFGELWLVFLYVVGTGWAWCKYWWFRFALFYQSVVYPVRARLANADHTLLLMGDGLVLGYGDYVTLTGTWGLSARLKAVLSSLPNRRRGWDVITMGHLYSTTDDWLPNSSRQPHHRPKSIRANLWTDAWQKLEQPRVDIAVLLVGGWDHKYGKDPSDLEKTLYHWQQLALHLRKRSEFVVIVPTPIAGLHLGSRRANITRNKLLAQWMNKQPDPNIVMGPSLEQRDYLRWFSSFDPPHMSSKGYKRLASELGELVHKMIIACEYKHFRRLLAPKKHT
mmetsp:Transcript_13195/g.33682  ORF Transcript_13195/g.33682 Transcript_13195/m.33682 type:complete len:282 (-) Transcript_13195:35-880(-)